MTERGINEWQKWETFVKPEQPGQPLIRVMKKEEVDYFEGDFAVELAGVGRRRNSDRSTDRFEHTKINDSPDLHAKMLATTLSGRQELRFEYSMGLRGAGNEGFSLKIRGISRGESSDEAVLSVCSLWQNLNITLVALHQAYSFVPVVARERLAERYRDWKWTGTIKPSGITIASKHSQLIGFMQHSNSVPIGPAIILPCENEEQRNRSFDAVVLGANGRLGDMKIELSLTNLSLSRTELRQLGSALEQLQTGRAKQVFHQMELDNIADDGVWTKRLIDMLNLWTKNPSGVKIRFRVLSNEPIPVSYLTLLGTEVFNAQVTVTTRRFKRESIVKSNPIVIDDPDVVDLCGCFNRNNVLPALIPQCETLLDGGVKMSFTDQPVDIFRSGILIGHTGHVAASREVRLSSVDRSRHAYMIGATGTGKSELLRQMIRQDIENGEGVTVIDPHGDLYEQILSSIPTSRMNDVILIDPCDFDYAVGINFLECSGRYKDVQITFVANEMIKIMDRLYDLKHTGGPMFEQYFRNAILLILSNDLQGMTLMDVPALFEDSDYRLYLKEHCKNPYVESFWTRQAEQAGGESSLANMVPYITSKLNQFVSNAILRPIIGQPKSTVDFRRAMDSGKIILVNLSKGMIGELDSQLLGMLIIGKIFSAAMGRLALKAEERKPMRLYIDEFQNFTTDSIAYLLSEARKFGLHLTLANQKTAQLAANIGRQNLLESVLGNVGSLLMFRLGVKDAEQMEPYVKPLLTSQDLQELPDFHVAGRLLNNNAPVRPFIFKTVPISTPSNAQHSHNIVDHSRTKYSTPVAKVEADLMARRASFRKLEDL